MSRIVGVWPASVAWTLGSRLIVIAASLLCFAVAHTQTTDVYGNASCAGCHGPSAMGGLGPPIAKTRLDYATFLKTVRNGKAMMPPVPPNEVSDKDVQTIYNEVKAKPWLPDQVPVAYKVGQVLTVPQLTKLFAFVFGLSFLMGLGVLVKTLKNGGFGSLWPYARRLGLGRVLAVVLHSLVVDGLFVGSLYRRDKFRWVMHGLMLYGFCGLLLADVLMAIYNPARSHLPVLSPLKLLPMFSGMAVALGVFYVLYRYKKDEYIDNGLTLGRDFAFVNLILHTVVSGFLTVWINRSGLTQYVMPIYLYHLTAMSALVLTAPFTRFQHAFLVPALAATTRLTQAVVAAGADIGFAREPSPGRHHKSERIVGDLLKQLGPEYEGGFRLRYFP